MGLRPNAADHYFIELEEFRPFVQVMWDSYFSSRHALLAGVLAVSVDMLDRCGVELAVRTPEPAESWPRSMRR